MLITGTLFQPGMPNVPAFHLFNYSTGLDIGYLPCNILILQNQIGDRHLIFLISSVCERKLGMVYLSSP